MYQTDDTTQLEWCRCVINIAHKLFIIKINYYKCFIQIMCIKLYHQCTCDWGRANGRFGSNSNRTNKNKNQTFMKIEIESSKSHWFDLVPNIFCRNRHRIKLKFGSQMQNRTELSRHVIKSHRTKLHDSIRIYKFGSILHSPRNCVMALVKFEPGL